MFVHPQTLAIIGTYCKNIEYLEIRVHFAEHEKIYLLLHLPSTLQSLDITPYQMIGDAPLMIN